MAEVKLTAVCDELYTPEVRAAIAERFRLEPEGLEEQEGFASYVYKGAAASGPVALKIAHSSLIGPEALAGELGFVAFLHERFVPVAPVHIAEGGAPVARVEDGAGGCFFGTCFAWVPGPLLEDIPKEPAVLRRVGEALGLLHNASEELAADGVSLSRPSVADNDSYDFDKHLPPEQTRVREVFRELLDRVHALPKTPASYGLTHSDCHDGNIIVDPGRGPVFIDFDDCEAHHYINDLAIMVYTFLPPEGAASGDYAAHVFRELVAGYLAARPTPPERFAQLPLFLKFRAFMIHVLCSQVAALTGIPCDPAALKKRVARFESGFEDLRCILEIDYAALAAL